MDGEVGVLVDRGRGGWKENGQMDNGQVGGGKMDEWLDERGMHGRVIFKQER